VPDRDHLVRCELDLSAAGKEPLDSGVEEYCGRLLAGEAA